MKNLFGSLLYGINIIYEKAILRMSLVSQNINEWTNGHAKYK